MAFREIRNTTVFMADKTYTTRVFVVATTKLTQFLLPFFFSFFSSWLRQNLHNSCFLFHDKPLIKKKDHKTVTMCGTEEQFKQFKVFVGNACVCVTWMRVYESLTTQRQEPYTQLTVNVLMGPTNSLSCALGVLSVHFQSWIHTRTMYFVQRSKLNHTRTIYFVQRSKLSPY